MKTLIKISLFLFSTVTFAAYNANNAVSYAQLWAQLRNPQYKNFGPDADCTNFLSQSFRAGGITDQKSIYSGSYLDYNHIANWYYMNGNTTNPSSTSFSKTWSVADTMYRRLKAGYDNWYFVGSFPLQSTSNINVNYGDVVFAEWDPINNPGINHAMIVTGYYLLSGAYYPRLSYHSNDKLNNPFVTFKVAALLYYPNTKLYVFRRSSTVVIPPSWQVF